MKKLLSISILLLSIFAFSHSNAFAQHNTKLGVGVVYGEAVESAGINANATFRVAPQFAIAPNINIYFVDDDEDAPGYIDSWWAVNLNGHYIFAADTDYHVYGLGGLNVTSVEFEGSDNSESELGINLGIGGEYHLESLSLFSEVKYIVSDLDQVVLAVGARFPLN